MLTFCQINPLTVDILVGEIDECRVTIQVRPRIGQEEMAVMEEFRLWFSDKEVTIEFMKEYLTIVGFPRGAFTFHVLTGSI